LPQMVGQNPALMVKKCIASAIGKAVAKPDAVKEKKLVLISPLKECDFFKDIIFLQMLTSLLVFFVIDFID